MEEEHPLPLRPGNDTCLGVAQSHCTVATQSTEVRARIDQSDVCHMTST